MKKSGKRFNKIGIILGQGLGLFSFLKEKKRKIVRTPFGAVEILVRDNFLFLFRHGRKNKIPPHKINHKANLFAFKKEGVNLIIAFNSVGSLKNEIKPGEIVLISDCIDFSPPTFFEKKCLHIVPEISEKARKFLEKILKELKIKFRRKGIYFQTRGPRLETKAEINLIKNFGDLVGMTMAKEATLAQELNLPYCSLAFVDNYAHGIGKRPLTLREIQKNQKKNLKVIEKIIKKICLSS